MAAISKPALPRLATREVVLVATILAIFMVSIEATIIATAMPTIVGDLGGLRLFSWVFGAYFLTQGVTIPIYGRLADFFGRKLLLIVAIVIFLTGSVLCGFAHDMLALILFRGLQGIGAGGVQPMAMTIVGDLYQGRERAKVMGYLSTVWAFAAVVGPLLGAFLVQHVGWPAVFWINVPFGAGCIAMLQRFLREEIEPVAHTIDYQGAVLLALGVGTLMYVLVMAGSMSGVVTGVLGIAALALIVWLIVHETRAPEPMLPIEIYRLPVITIANVGNFATGALVMGISAFLPTYVQGAMGLSAVLAGSALGVMLVSWTMGAIIGSRLMLRLSYRIVGIAGGIATVAGGAVLIAMTLERGLPWAVTGVGLLGFGFGLANSVFVIATQAAVGWEQRGSATASNLFSRQMGQAIGTAAFGAVFNIGVYARIPDAGTAVAQLMNPAVRSHFPPLELARDANAVALSIHPVYILMGVIAAVLLAFTCAIPSKMRLGQTTSGS